MGRCNNCNIAGWILFIRGDVDNIRNALKRSLYPRFILQGLVYLKDRKDGHIPIEQKKSSIGSGGHINKPIIFIENSISKYIGT